MLRRPTPSHNDRRLMLHCFGFVDPKRIADANAQVGNASWLHPFASICGDLNAALHYMPRYTARILKFPAKAGMK